MATSDYDKFCDRYSDAELAHMMRHVMLTRPDVAAQAEKGLALFMENYGDTYAGRLLKAS